MTKTFTQNIVFKNVDAKSLYELYLNQEKHSDVTNAVAKIEAKENTEFSAYDEYITGKNLQLIPNVLIVQSWRASDWEDDDIDSTFIIQFEQQGKDVLMNITHANVPDIHAASLDKGWHEHYWDLWKAHLNSK